MKYGSICSGVEAATLAWRPLGWKAVFLPRLSHSHQRCCVIESIQSDSSIAAA